MAISSQMVHALSSGAISEHAIEGVAASDDIYSRSQVGDRKDSVNSLLTLDTQPQEYKDAERRHRGDSLLMPSAQAPAAAQQRGAPPSEGEAQSNVGLREGWNRNGRVNPARGLPPLAPALAPNAAEEGAQRTPDLAPRNRLPPLTVNGAPSPPCSAVTAPLQRLITCPPPESNQVYEHQGGAGLSGTDHPESATSLLEPKPSSLSSSPQHDRKRSKIRMDAAPSKSAGKSAGAEESETHPRNFEVRMVPTSPEVPRHSYSHPRPFFGSLPPSNMQLSAIYCSTQVNTFRQGVAVMMIAAF